jgi:hypothetical protein
MEVAVEPSIRASESSVLGPMSHGVHTQQNKCGKSVDRLTHRMPKKTCEHNKRSLARHKAVHQAARQVKASASCVRLSAVSTHLFLA